MFLMFRKSPLAYCHFSLLAISLALATGCAPAAPASYVSSEQVQELPEADQQQIRTLLLRFFGTPSNPRRMKPVLGEAGEQVNSDEPAEGAEDGYAMAPQVDAAVLERGAAVYTHRCAACHGVTGNGDGPAARYLQPKPRDYRRGTFKFTSTPRGAKPLRSDLVQVIRNGAKGTSMPAFQFLSDQDLQAVIDYVILLSQRGELENRLVPLAEDESLEPEFVTEEFEYVLNGWRGAGDQVVMPLTPRPKTTEASIEQGRQAFLTRGCAKCHGEDGRGRTRDNVGKDDWGNSVQAADITSGMLHGGRRPIDIYRRIYSGINGTPMPAFGAALKDEPETIWHLVQYVQALASGREFDNAQVTLAPAAAPVKTPESNDTP